MREIIRLRDKVSDDNELGDNTVSFQYLSEYYWAREGYIWKYEGNGSQDHPFVCGWGAYLKRELRFLQDLAIQRSCTIYLRFSQTTYEIEAELICILGTGEVLEKSQYTFDE